MELWGVIVELWGIIVELWGVIVEVGDVIVELYGVMVLLPSIIPVPYMSSMDSTCDQNTGRVCTIVHLYNKFSLYSSNRKYTSTCIKVRCQCYSDRTIKQEVYSQDTLVYYFNLKCLSNLFTTLYVCIRS